jgi:hypothetical protein
MNLLTTITIAFLILEASNVAALYFFPGSKYANAMGVFKAWKQSKNHPEIHDLVRYLVNWVAGSKLIFILLLIVILVAADERTLIFAALSLVISIASFFWRLFPLIRKMDREGQIEPSNYSAVLGWMIAAFILVFMSGLMFAIFS